MSAAIDVIRARGGPTQQLVQLLERYGLKAVLLPQHAEIPGSYWGESEAGLIGSVVFFREDTPLHSILHEASHFICMDDERRTALERDAGGDDAEENAVCYLQILLAGEIPALGRARMFSDMDSWGYTFRLGSAQTWFERDAEDARQWLVAHGVIDAVGRITGKKRHSP